MLTDTTPVVTDKAVAGTSTGNVVLATFTDAIPPSGLFTDLTVPGATATYVKAVSGNDVLGEYVAGGVAYGFLYNISTSAYTSFAPPGSVSTLADGVSGNDVAGYYGDGSGVTHGYVYDMLTATYTTIDPPGRPTPMSSPPPAMTSSGNMLPAAWPTASCTTSRPRRTPRSLRPARSARWPRRLRQRRCGVLWRR